VSNACSAPSVSIEETTPNPAQDWLALEFSQRNAGFPKSEDPHGSTLSTGEVKATH
jgi:hypothetical protein